MRVNVTLVVQNVEIEIISQQNKRNNPERVEMKNIVHVIINILYIVKLNN